MSPYFYIYNTNVHGINEDEIKAIMNKDGRSLVFAVTEFDCIFFTYNKCSIKKVRCLNIRNSNETSLLKARLNKILFAFAVIAEDLSRVPHRPEQHVCGSKANWLADPSNPSATRVGKLYL